MWRAYRDGVLLRRGSGGGGEGEVRGWKLRAVVILPMWWDREIGCGDGDGVNVGLETGLGGMNRLAPLGRRWFRRTCLLYLAPVFAPRRISLRLVGLLGFRLWLCLRLCLGEHGQLVVRGREVDDIIEYGRNLLAFLRTCSRPHLGPFCNIHHVRVRKLDPTVCPSGGREDGRQGRCGQTAGGRRRSRGNGWERRGHGLERRHVTRWKRGKGGRPNRDNRFYRCCALPLDRRTWTGFDFRSRRHRGKS